VKKNSLLKNKDRLKYSVKRLDEVLDGLTWAACRKPDSFPKVRGINLYLAKTDATFDTPALYVWFTFDDDHVYFLSIEETPKAE
jgi:hypothetical protein